MAIINEPKDAWQLRVYPLFTLLGWVLITVSIIIGLFVLSSSAASYWGESAKAVRDTAEAGSALLGQLNVLAVTPRWLEPLTFLGVAAFMVGIALEFSSIPDLLNNRGHVMGVCFPLIVKQSGE